MKVPVVLAAVVIVAATHGAHDAAAGPQAGSAELKTVWHGVYTEAQAKRGLAEYEANCMSCHKTNLDRINPESRLKGDVFMDRWREDDLDSLFNLIQATMPRSKPGSLSPKTYVDIISYLLQSNDFPPGSEELSLDVLKSVRIEGKDGPRPLPNGALVQLVGCLTQELTQDRAVWILTGGSEPVRTRRPKESTASELKAAAAQPLGHQTFRLQSIDYLTQFLGMRIETHRGRKMLAKGYLVRQPNRQRIDITFLEMAAPGCTK